MEKDIGWSFPIDDAGEIEGLKGGDIETFLDNPLFSIAKESAQNSLDAQLNKKKPVILEFNSFFLEKGEFPGYNEFNNHLDRLILFWGKMKKDKSSEHFFKKAKDILKSEKILCLRISDFNTTGLSGAMEEEEPFTGWKKLVKSTGVSDNPSGAGGSFGLGKHASFACSYLRTVFYNTLDTFGIKAYQGVAQLATCQNEKGENTRRKGYYGKINDFSNIKETLVLEKSFLRKESGTDIYILGFNNREKNWKDKIICSIIDSFLLALHNGNLIFKFDGEQLDKDSLKMVIEKYRSEEYSEFIKPYVFDYYDILEGKMPSIEYKYSLFDKNDICIKLALGTGLSNKISMNRNNGMKIFDKIRPRGIDDCAGVLVLKGEKINEYFRKLENPEHNKWVAERGENPKEAENKIKLLYKNINESINKMSDQMQPESLDAEGMGEYLPDEIDEDISKRAKIEDIPWEINKATIIERKKSKQKTILKVFGGGKGKRKNNSSGGNKSNGGPGQDPNKELKKTIKTENVRVFLDNSGDYNLLFSIIEDSSSLNAEILISGESETEPPIIESAKLILEKEFVELNSKINNIFVGKIIKDKQVKIKFKLKEDYKWALEVRFYED